MDQYAPFNILIADDEPNISKGLSKALALTGNYQFFCAGDGREAWKIMRQEEIDLALIDLKMPEMDGAELLKRINHDFFSVPVIVLTGHGSIEHAVNAMRSGAYDFLTKPIDLDRLELIVKRALQSRELKRQHRELKQELEFLQTQQKNEYFVSKSPQMRRIYELTRQVAKTRANILITGESGVGKEIIADALHDLSERSKKKLIKVHCAALSESLLESELFGHEKGAFTGANSARKGRFELADGGSIFLDEIGEINSQLQIKLLRVIQEKRFERVGGETTLEVDTRIIAATNRDLKKEVEEGRFREDLFYRLNVVNIHIPPLRERKEDIPILASHFFEKAVKENRRSEELDGISPKAVNLLYNYHWPGNIRELQNSIESAVVMSRNKLIMPEDLPPALQKQDNRNYISIPLGIEMRKIEEMVIRATIAYTQGNKTQAAKILNIGRKTLHRKLQNYKMDL